MKQHLPSVEALTAPDDHRLLTELEISNVLERLARIRALIDRTDRFLSIVLNVAENNENKTESKTGTDNETAPRSGRPASDEG